MPVALITALAFTSILLVITAYFIMGSLPLLILKHDTPKDARFVRGFFDTYYLTAIFPAGATAVSYAFAGRVLFAVGAAALALLAIVLRRTVIPKMASLGGQIEASETSAIRGFRRVHATAILINLAQLALIAWSLIALSIQMK